MSIFSIYQKFWCKYFSLHILIYNILDAVYRKKERKNKQQEEYNNHK